MGKVSARQVLVKSSFMADLELAHLRLIRSPMPHASTQTNSVYIWPSSLSSSPSPYTSSARLASCLQIRQATGSFNSYLAYAQQITFQVSPELLNLSLRNEYHKMNKPLRPAHLSDNILGRNYSRNPGFEHIRHNSTRCPSYLSNIFNGDALSPVGGSEDLDDALVQQVTLDLRLQHNSPRSLGHIHLDPSMACLDALSDSIKPWQARGED
ncbi:unnamed protein product [Protopolystoma xenopodis]|uniref:Uncharacterized protein n=1 Tax=Protopolystoma xenopodis TaxID=117903 RepID=A0A3S5CNQ7_9PLAT|nr:unnamed protein product [Protopolystoma xenopodis]